MHCRPAVACGCSTWGGKLTAVTWRMLTLCLRGIPHRPLQLAERQLSLERDPWKVATVEQQIAAGDATAAAAGAGPAQFVEQELLVEPEPEEDEEGGSGSEVQR